MRRGMRLIALGVLGALAIPLPSHATQGKASADLVTEVVVSSRVQHLGSGTIGNFTLTLKKLQGVSFNKPPIGQRLDDYALDVHVGENLPSAGLPRFIGCMTLRISGVVTHTRRCHIFGGSASLDPEPALTAMAVGATMGPDNEYKTTIAMNLEAKDSAPAQETTARNVDPRATTKSGGGFLADSQEGIKRLGVIRGGIIIDETPDVNSIVFVTNSESVTMRQYVDVHASFSREALACGGGDNRGIVIGAAGVNPDILTNDNEDPDTLPQPGPGNDGPEYIAIPPGCHPDDELESLPADLP